jgi:hypothetical protein
MSTSGKGSFRKGPIDIRGDNKLPVLGIIACGMLEDELAHVLARYIFWQTAKGRD